MFFDACYLDLDGVINFSVNVRKAWQWVGRTAVRGRRGWGEAVTRNKTVFFISHFLRKKGRQSPNTYCSSFRWRESKEHLQCSSFLIFSSLSPCNSSSILPRQCLLSNWYERMAPGPSGVKWYKVIGRSSLLTGWPLKALLKGANQILPLPPSSGSLLISLPTSPAHQQPVSHDHGEASERGWLMMLLVPV